MQEASRSILCSSEGVSASDAVVEGERLLSDRASG